MIKAVRLAALLLAVAGLVALASEGDFLRDAVSSDQTLGELVKMLNGLTEQMKLSNVFTPVDINDNTDVAVQMARTRENDMRAVLHALEASVQDLQQKSAHLKDAQDGHVRISDRLGGIAARLRGAGKVSQDTLNRLEALVRDTDALAREKADTGGLKPQSIDKSEALSATATNLAGDVEDPLAAKYLKDGGNDLANKDVVQAKEKIDKAAAVLRAQADDDRSPVAAMAEKAEALKDLANKADKALKDATAAANEKDPAKAQEKALDAMVSTDDLKKGLEENAMTKAADTATQAENNLAQNQPAEAAKALDGLKKDLNEQARDMANQIARAAEKQADFIKALTQATAEVQRLEQMQSAVGELVNDYQAAMQGGQQAQTPPAGQPAGQTPPPPAGGTMAPKDQQRLGGQIDQLGNEMKQAQLDEAGGHMDKAEDATGKGEFKPGLDELKESAKSLDKAMAAAQAKLDKLAGDAAMAMAPGQPNQPPQPGQPQPGQPQPGQPSQPSPQPPQGPPTTSENADDTRKFGTQAAAAGAAKPNGSWQAALPDRERQALLSARRESYAPNMDQDVKNYFKNLAE